MLNRRKMLKMLATLPLAGGWAATGLGNRVNAAQLRPPYPRDYLTELGLRTFINARGALTILTGTLMEPEVAEAMKSVSDQFVKYVDIKRAVGKRIAEMLNCEAATVTAGAASALTLGTAGTITGTDMELIRLLPNLPGPQKEVIIQKNHRFAYDHAVRNTGIKFIEIESAREMERAINENTVMALFFNAAAQFGEHNIGHEEFVAIGKKHGVPTFIDAAADVPPKENLFKYIEIGFDLVTFSGGKAIRGPQSAGLLYGRKDLIEAAMLNHSPSIVHPYGDTIGRGMKVNKEEMVGMMVALELYLKKDHDKEWQEWLGRVERINRRVSTVPTVVAEERIPEGPANLYPGCRISWDQNRIRITPDEMEEALRNGYPSIEASSRDETLRITVSMLKPEEVDVVGWRIKEELEKAMT